MSNSSIYFSSLLLSLIIISSSQTSASSPSLTDRFVFKPLKQQPIISSPEQPQAQEYVDPTFPPPLLPNTSPSCSRLILNHSFANTYGLPPVTVPYSPPLPPSNCSAPWGRVVLTLSVSSAGDQYDRIAAVWLAGAEILRTSTAEPTEAGVFWHVRKDVTKYHSLLQRPNNVTMMLENLVNDEFTGIYHCNLSLEFYPEVDDDDAYTARRISREETKPVLLLPRSKRKKQIATNDDPADLILPVSNESPETGYWFRIQNKSSDVHSRSVVIPSNTYRAVLEVYLSFHGNDEFWYSNPPNSYIEKNNLTTGRGNGAFRRVFATIDGKLVGSIVPFPVIFTGGINPLFWAPVVAIGAFNLPSYNLDITPFLGLLLDGKPHEFGLNVTDGISFWLVDANLHLWLDHKSTKVKAKLTQYLAPPLSVACSSKFSHLNGTFKIDAGIKLHFSGWVNSSFGNLTTDINQKVKIKHLMLILKDGNYKEVHMKAKLKMGVRITKGQGVLLSQTAHKYKYPLMIMSSITPGENNTYGMNTSLSHTYHEEVLSLYGDTVLSAKILSDTQDADGWMLVRDHSVLSGSAGTQQKYQYTGTAGCYTREVSAKDGKILKDSKTTACPPPPS